MGIGELTAPRAASVARRSYNLPHSHSGWLTVAFHTWVPYLPSYIRWVLSARISELLTDYAMAFLKEMGITAKKSEVRARGEREREGGQRKGGQRKGVWGSSSCMLPTCPCIRTTHAPTVTSGHYSCT
jgi:hypothetical protein